MEILIACTEMVPFAKTGGLADVTGALPPALTGQGTKVSAILPCYRGIEARYRPRPTGVTVTIPLLQGEELVDQQGEILVAELEGGIPVYFVKHEGFFNREGLYGTPDGDYSDNCARFTFFCKAVLEFLRARNLAPGVIHCHDWQTALIPIYLKTILRDDPAFAEVRTALTIHNLGYQGKFWHWDMKLIGLPWDWFTMEYLEYYGGLNLLKGGIVFADAITTVSQGYAREIQTEEMSAGLGDVIRRRAGSLHGILNGIDYRIWDPAQDRHLAATYTPEDLSGKARCKAALQRELGLEEKPGVPLAGIISRLADQKGFDILAESFTALMNKGIQFALLGTGERKYQDYFNALTQKFPGRVGIRIGFDEGLAHRIEAGSDLFLMPSLYEPCGLNQLISLKYGTVPVVRATGGLDDTIVPWNGRARKGNGFKFLPYTGLALINSVAEALESFARPEEWQALMHNGMKEDHSWDSAAGKYLDLFCALTGEARPKSRAARPAIHAVPAETGAAPKKAARKTAAKKSAAAKTPAAKPVSKKAAARAPKKTATRKAAKMGGPETK